MELSENSYLITTTYISQMGTNPYEKFLTVRAPILDICHIKSPKYFGGQFYRTFDNEVGINSCFSSQKGPHI